MADTDRSLLVRVNGLGFECEALSRDRLDSAAAALCCFPMYMVAHAGVLVSTAASERRDLLGLASLREFFVIGEQEADMQEIFDLDANHVDALHEQVRARPDDPSLHEDGVRAAPVSRFTVSGLMAADAQTQ